jgi:nitrate reductase delta subunit
LLALIGAEADIEAHRPAVAVEAPDHTPEALDAVWEEEAVRFSADSDRDCALQSAEGRRLAERKREQPAQVVNILSPTPPAAGQ